MTAIGPGTKLGSLLDEHPELEEALVARSSAYRALRNPMLRRTVAKLATLEQVAKVGDVPLPEFLAMVAAAIGAGTEIERVETRTAGTLHAAFEPRPAWCADGVPVHRIDADELLAHDEHPLTVVRRFLKEHGPGGVVALASSFVPQPLVDALARDGARTWIVDRGGGRYLTLIDKPRVT